MEQVFGFNIRDDGTMGRISYVDSGAAPFFVSDRSWFYWKAFDFENLVAFESTPDNLRRGRA